MREDPEAYLKYRKNVESEMVAGFAVFHRNSPESKSAIEVCLFYSTQEIRAYDENSMHRLR